MNVVWNLLLRGCSMPRRDTVSERFVYWLGRQLACRHRRVRVDPSCLIHPEAMICPRDGEIVIGARTTVACGTAIQGHVTLGADCSVQLNGNLVGYDGGSITIGDGVRIAANCLMMGQNHRFDRLDLPIRSQGTARAPIQIADDVWIGSYVKILAGVTIGTGAVIGAGSVVTRDVPAYAVAVGVPARVIRSRR